MIRRALVLLIVVMILSAAADWQHFKAQARPVLQPIVEWTEAETNTPKIMPADQTPRRSVDELIRSLDELDPRSTAAPRIEMVPQRGPLLQQALNGSQLDDHRTVRDWLRLVESALDEARQESERLQREMEAAATRETTAQGTKDFDRRRALLRERVLRLSALQETLQQKH